MTDVPTNVSPADVVAPNFWDSLPTKIVAGLCILGILASWVLYALRDSVDIGFDYDFLHALAATGGFIALWVASALFRRANAKKQAFRVPATTSPREDD